MQKKKIVITPETKLGEILEDGEFSVLGKKINGVEETILLKEGILQEEKCEKKEKIIVVEDTDSDLKEICDKLWKEQDLPEKLCDFGDKFKEQYTVKYHEYLSKVVDKITLNNENEDTNISENHSLNKKKEIKITDSLPLKEAVDGFGEKTIKSYINERIKNINKKKFLIDIPRI